MYKLKIGKFNDELAPKSYSNVVFYNPKDIQYKECYLIVLEPKKRDPGDEFVFMGVSHLGFSC
jgi:hypothetical protein